MWPRNGNPWDIHFFTVFSVTLGIHVKTMILQWKQCGRALLCNDFITQGAEHICGLVIHWFSLLYIVSPGLCICTVCRGFCFFFFYNSFFNCIISNKELSRFLFYFTNFAVCNDFYCVCICGELVVWAQIHHLVIWCSLYCFFDLFSFLKNWAVTNILHLPILLINKNENKWYFVHWMLINHLYTYFSFVFAHLLFPMGTFISLWWDPFLKTASSLSIIALYIWLEIAFSFITISSYMYLYVRKKIISVSSSVVNIILSYCFISSLWTLNLELVTHLDNTQLFFYVFIYISFRFSYNFVSQVVLKHYTWPNFIPPDNIYYLSA